MFVIKSWEEFSYRTSSWRRGLTSNDIRHFLIWASYVHTKDFLLEMSSRREPVLRQSLNHQTRCTTTLHLMYLFQLLEHQM